MKICNYIPVKQDKRRTLNNSQIQRMKEMREQGISYYKIAKRMKCHYTTIMRYLVPGFAKRQKLRVNEINKKRFAVDKKYRETQIVQCNSRNLKRAQKEPKYKDYLHCVSRRWHLKHKDYYANYRKIHRKTSN